MADDDDLERQVNDAFDEADPLGAQLREAGFREVLPGDSDWIEVAESFDPIRLTRPPERLP